jgi:hypothetical protein
MHTQDHKPKKWPNGFTNCPVKAMAHRIHHILSNKGNTSNMLFDVWTNAGWYQVTPMDMIVQV